MIQPFFSPQGVSKCQNIETMLLSLMAMAGGISEHMLTSWSSKWCLNPESSLGPWNRFKLHSSCRLLTVLRRWF